MVEGEGSRVEEGMRGLRTQIEERREWLCTQIEEYMEGLRSQFVHQMGQEYWRMRPNWLAGNRDCSPGTRQLVWVSFPYVALLRQQSRYRQSLLQGLRARLSSSFLL